MMRRKQKQNHFNSKDSGVQTSNKRRDLELSKTSQKIVNSQLPYLK